MAGRGRDLERIDELLSQLLLLRAERTELYDLAHKRSVDVRQRRLRALLRQRVLLVDDLEELRRISDELGVSVDTRRLYLDQEP